MAIENEFKYLVGTDVMSDLYSKLEASLVTHPENSKVRIDQFYIKDTPNRVRKTTHVDGSVVYTHASKYQTGVLVEIETDIEKSDYDMVSRTQKGHLISKYRFKIPAEGLVWEIDFFVSDAFDGEYYLSLIEVEMSPEVKVRPKLPPMLKPYSVMDIEGMRSGYTNSRMFCATRAFRQAAHDTNRFRAEHG